MFTNSSKDAKMYKKPKILFVLSMKFFLKTTYTQKFKIEEILLYCPNCPNCPIENVGMLRISLYTILW